jgi:hypothetical protein
VGQQRGHAAWGNNLAMPRGQRWEMALRDPHPALRPHVRRYAGWFEHMAAPDETEFSQGAA